MLPFTSDENSDVKESNQIVDSAPKQRFSFFGLLSEKPKNEKPDVIIPDDKKSIIFEINIDKNIEKHYIDKRKLMFNAPKRKPNAHLKKLHKYNKKN